MYNHRTDSSKHSATALFTKNALSGVVLALMTSSLAYAADDTTVAQLAPIEVKAEEDNLLKKDQIITKNEDIARYSTDIAVPQTGRFGSRGFNIRGVEGNQVAITVDGVSQAESNDYATFRRYSYYNNSRGVVDSELMGDISINKSADSSVGNGALGGSVNYTTKTTKDILLSGRKTGVLVKHIYDGSQNAWINTVGGALDTQYIDAVAVYSHQRGHELQINSDGPNIMGSGRGLPNPMMHYQYSYLGKLGIKWNDENRLELKTLKQRSKNIGQELSYSTITLRDFYDIQEVESYGINYRYTPKATWLGELKIDLSQQDSKINGKNSQISISTGRVTDNTTRGFETESKQAIVGLTTKPFKLAGQHQISAQIGYGDQDFSFNSQTTMASPSGIDMQAPVAQDRYFITLGDKMQFGSQFSANLNTRFEHLSYKPSNSSLGNKSYSLWAGDLGIYYSFIPNWQVGYKISRGFRAPTSSEMYFDYSIGTFQSFLANTSLSPETSIGHELSLNAFGRLGHLNASAYYNDYNNLIETVTVASNTYQQQNADDATIKGIDISGTLNLNGVWNVLPEGLEFTSGVGYAKGKRDDGANVLSVQPLKVLFGLGYVAPQNNWSVRLQGTYHAAKRANDAQEYAITPNSGYIAKASTLSTYRYLSPAATVFDLIGHKNFYGDQVKLQFGIYNLFNKRYATWDSLRTIGSTNVTVANQVTGEGINRYNAPERYVKASVEFKF